MMNTWCCRAFGGFILGLTMFAGHWFGQESWAVAARQVPSSTCRKVCKRISLKHATRRCRHQWKCGLQRECQWVERVLTDATGQRRMFRVRECGYVRRCSFVEQCRYQSWKWQCVSRCEPDGVLAPLRRVAANPSTLTLRTDQLGQCVLNQQEKWLLAAINQERYRRKLRLLRCDVSLLNAARDWSRMQCFRGELSHDRLPQRLKEHQVKASLYAENVAAGKAQVSQIFQLWMRSKKHRGYILHPQFSHVGVGLYLCGVSEHTHYWTQIFACLKNK